MYKYHDLQTQTVYAELVARCGDPVAVGDGIQFTSRVSNSVTYWDIRFQFGDQKLTRSLGKETPELLAAIEKQRALYSTSKIDSQDRNRLVAMYLQGSAFQMPPAEGKLLGLLVEGGYFLSGCVLVGTPAFRYLSNHLGVSWAISQQTEDIDLAYPLALPQEIKNVSLKEVLDNAGLGFFEVPRINRKQASTKFKSRDLNYSIEIITPCVDHREYQSVYFSNIKTHAQSIRYLEYLLENTVPVIVPYQHGLPVLVPAPGRFALHKLVVYSRRIDFPVKREKDLKQAESLIRLLADTNPGELLLAYDAAQKMGDKFLGYLHEGMSNCDDETQNLLPFSIE